MINYDELAKGLQNRYCPGCKRDCYGCIMDDIDTIKPLIDAFLKEIKTCAMIENELVIEP